MKRKIMQELRATIEIFVKKVLNNEKDLKRKIDIVMGCRRTSLIEMSFYDMFYDLLHKAARSTILTYEEKLIILKKFMSSHPSFFIYDNISIITEFYLGCGKISGDVFDKREWLEDIIKYLRPKTIEEIDNILEDIYYERLGDICRICESEENDIHFTDDIVSVHDKYFAKFEFGTINDTILDRKLPKKMRGISNEIVEKILSEIKNIMAVEGYDKFRLIIIREVNYISDDYNILEQRTDFIKDYRIRIIDDERQVDNIYIINEDGTLQLLEVGEKRRFTDDMSELDIKLKEQTEDVSVIEMIEGANDLQMALKLDERVSEESSRGEEEND